MQLVLAFTMLAAAALLLTMAVADASASEVISGQAGALYRQHETSTGASTSSPSSPSTSSSSPTPNSAGYVAPFTLTSALGRTDQGVDYNLTAGAPILAIGKSKVIGIIPNWFKGQPFVWLQLLDGPQAGRYYYVAEQIVPKVTAGQIVQAGQTIATFAAHGTGDEIGWATASGQTLARATTGYTEGQATTAGSSFRAFLSSLGIS